VAEHTYAAFISYAHADEPAAKKLHMALETYPLPKGMDASARQKLTPIFRDVTELTAHHSLSEKIKDAVEHSRFLIVLCSPAAKASHWVNEEIRLFRRLHGEGSILSVIVEGDPASAFPPALTEDSREPLAADISGREGFRFGVTQLAASMLGVGLDTLVQRDQKRRRRRSQSISVVTTALAFIMGGLAYTAIDARDEAEVSRNEAEELVEYMLGDLKSELESVGRLPILNGVGEKVAEYYEAIPLVDMDDDRLGRRSEARHLLGQVYLKQGLNDKALLEFEAAFDATKELLARNPENNEVIFTHSQSEYWVGEFYSSQKDYEKVLPYWTNYENYGKALYKSDPENPRWVQEAGWGANNLGKTFENIGDYESAINKYSEAEKYFSELMLKHPKHDGYAYETANIMGGSSNTFEGQGQYNQAIEKRKQQLPILSNLLKSDANNFKLNLKITRVKLHLLRLSFLEKNYCDISEIKSGLSPLIELSIFDPDNYNLLYDYVDFSQELLTICEEKISSMEWKNLHDELLAYSKDKLIENDLHSELSRLAQIRANLE